MSQRGVRRWCFTVNNPETVLDGIWVNLQPWLWPSCTFCVYQLEQGEERETPHFQGYAEFANAKTLGAMKKLKGLERAHFEATKGTAQQNVEYCTKESDRLDGPCTWGEVSSGQGKRTDLLEVKAAIDDGANDKELWQDHFGTMVRNHKAFNQYRLIVTPPRRLQATHITIIGPSGAGKTSSVYSMFPFDDIWKHPDAGEWFDGYTGQKVVLFDEMGGWRFKQRYLLQLLDAYPMSVPIKGGFVPFIPEVIVMTTNFEPETWYQSDNPWRDNPLRRRLECLERSLVYHVGDPAVEIDCQSLGICHVYLYPAAEGAPRALIPDRVPLPPAVVRNGVAQSGNLRGYYDANDPRPTSDLF